MNCPRCRRSLTGKTVDAITVDACERCGGMFLPRGTLDRIAEPHDGDLEFSTLHGESFRHEDTQGAADCPACSDVRMKKVEFNILTDIILDYCERCGAFWLDGSEMDRINDEVRELNRASDEPVGRGMLWFAQFIWSLPR